MNPDQPPDRRCGPVNPVQWPDHRRGPVNPVQWLDHFARAAKLVRPPDQLVGPRLQSRSRSRTGVCSDRPLGTRPWSDGQTGARLRRNWSGRRTARRATDLRRCNITDRRRLAVGLERAAPALRRPSAARHGLSVGPMSAWRRPAVGPASARHRLAVGPATSHGTPHHFRGIFGICARTPTFSREIRPAVAEMIRTWVARGGVIGWRRWVRFRLIRNAS